MPRKIHNKVTCASGNGIQIHKEEGYDWSNGLPMVINYMVHGGSRLTMGHLHIKNKTKQKQQVNSYSNGPFFPWSAVMGSLQSMPLDGLVL